jgi:alpha-tubulin suppressor-like RCC1 family protein
MVTKPKVHLGTALNVRIQKRYLVSLLILLLLLGQGCKSDSPTGNENPAPPQAPDGVTATAAPATVTLAWNAVAGATSYQVFWDNDGSVDASDSSLEAAASPFIHTSLTNGTPYHYRVAAVNGAGMSNLSGQVSATPNPALGVRFIACGENCSFLVNAQGYLYAWGNNSDGQLGIGSWSSQYEPVLVPGVSDVVAVSSNWRHTLVLTGSGQVYAMGYNTYGALGTGDNQGRWYPAQVSGPTNFVSIAAGRNHSLGITADGGAYVWGSNTGGVLGLGYEGGWVEVPTLAMTSFWYTPGQAAAGSNASFFKPDDDESHGSPIFSWGSDSDHLGRVTGGDPDVAHTPSSIPGTVVVTAVSSRYLHALGLREDGSVLSWGINAEGQLGRYTEGSSGLPDGVELVQHVTAVGAGNFHSLALGDDGRVMAWGLNGGGQLGDGTTIDSSTRTWVSNLTGITMIAAGGNHNLAVRNDGTVWAWGAGTSGQLGIGNTLNQVEPVRVHGF